MLCLMIWPDQESLSLVAQLGLALVLWLSLSPSFKLAVSQVPSQGL